MTMRRSRLITRSTAMALGGFLLAFNLFGCAEKPVVTTVKVDTRRLEVSFTERAETILRREYPITMPVNGRIGRIELEEGDRVRQGERLVSVDPTPARQEIEARQAAAEATQAQQQLGYDTSVEQYQLAQAEKRVDSVLAQTQQVASALEAARTALSNALAEEKRVERLVSEGALPERDLERARQGAAEARASLSAQESQREVLKAQMSEAQAAVNSNRAQVNRKVSQAQAQAAAVQEARARTEQAQYTLEKSSILSPIDGVVLKRSERGPTELGAGAPLLLLGRLNDLEVSCDVLSQDALRISRGTPVVLDAGTAFPEELKGEVRLKEPLGFTKRSSLGVEQQRVNVRVGLLDPPESLGVGYELWARFLVEQKTTLTLPRSCFVRRGNSFFVWRVDSSGRLEQVETEIGLRGDSLWEVVGPSLKAGERVVSAPSDQLQAGAEVDVQATQERSPSP